MNSCRREGGNPILGLVLDKRTGEKEKYYPSSGVESQRGFLTRTRSPSCFHAFSQFFCFTRGLGGLMSPRHLFNCPRCLALIGRGQVVNPLSPNTKLVERAASLSLPESSWERLLEKRRARGGERPCRTKQCAKCWCCISCTVIGEAGW